MPRLVDVERILLGAALGFAALVDTPQNNYLSCQMVTKAIRFLIFNMGVLACLCAAVNANSDQQIYSLPQTETEDVVISWLQGKGYLLRRSAIDNQGIRLFAQKGRRRWQIALWPHSPLATRIKATYTVNGTAESSHLQQLWELLDDHMKTIVGSPYRDAPPTPAAILSKSDSVVCIYVGYPEKSLQISGFIIDRKGLIICTAHGLRDIQQPLTVTFRDGRELPGWVVKMDKRLDLTLVDVKTELESSIHMTSGRDLLGKTERIYNVVCSNNSNGSIFPGIVSGPPRKTGHQLLWQANMLIRPGSSGSPVFDHQGNLVAVVKGRYRGADKVGFLIPFASLIHFLSDPPK